MKRKLLASLLSIAMVATLLVGCGNSKSTEKVETKTEVETEVEAEAETEVVDVPAEEGKVLNIYCWNDEFQRRLKDHYPGYEEIDATTGKIGDVTVVFTITPSADNAYQNKLDESLLAQNDSAVDNKIDLFLIEADYALKYVNSDYTMDVADIGVSTSDLSDQYKYTQDIVKDSQGKLKGVSWQGCPGVFIYRRSIAQAVFGTDDMATIQEKVADWETFEASAAEVKAGGYSMLAGFDDSYRVFSNNATSKWVVDNKISIDDSIMSWVEQTKTFTDNGYNNKTTLWSDGWSAGFTPEGNVFGYFGPAWFVDFILGGKGTDGDWYATAGPQGFYWGGTWICGATGTDNVSLIKDIILQMTTNDEIMTEIVKVDNDFVNNQSVMEEIAADTSYKSVVLGETNPLATYMAGASAIDLSNISPYDQGCNEEFQGAMKDYFDGNATLDEALQIFYDKVTVKYPELTY